MKNKKSWIVIVIFLFVLFGVANKGKSEKINWLATKQNVVQKAWNRIPGSDAIDAVEFFDDQKIYQDNKEVGTVVGDPQDNQDLLIFSKIFNTEKLQQDKPIKFREMVCQITNVSQFSVQERNVVIGGLNGGERKVENYHNVLNGVVCKKIN